MSELKKRTTRCPGRMFTNSEKDTRSIPWEFVRPALHRTAARASRKVTHALYSMRPRLCSTKRDCHSAPCSPECTARGESPGSGRLRHLALPFAPLPIYSARGCCTRCHN